ncbi:MAG: hypothetical protein PF503_17040 [Desulfobacula sp.]|jgi:hypothetical protein|nr:hypothetical protein [Desulfobacula sp.]
MLKQIKETEILKRYSKPPGDPPDKQPGGAISIFPNAPFELPSETFANSLNRRDQNRKELFGWIQRNFSEGIDWCRIHTSGACRYARAGSPNLCKDISHYSRPILFKSGAERIIGVLGLIATFPNLKQYEMACVHRQEIQTIILKCVLISQTGTVIGEGAGGRNIRQDNWNLNTSIKMCVKSALVDAVIRIAGLSGVFIKTHRHTLTKLGACHKNNLPDMGVCHGDNLTGTRVCNKQQNPIDTQYITEPQKDLILKLAGRFGITIDALDKRCKDIFGSALKDLERHYASKLISALNG